MRQIKKLLLILCMMLGVSITANASENGGNEYNWDAIIDAIIQVESKNDKNARHGSSLGVLQITPVCVEECNNILRRKKVKKRFSLSDRLSIKKSKEMFILIMNEYNKKHSAKEACRIWNGGINSKSVRQKYWEKFLKYYKK